MFKVLLVEDAEEFHVLVKKALADVCQIVSAHSAREAKILLDANSYDLILLDIGLPDKIGYELVQELRTGKSTKDTPIIILTARNAISDKVTGFSLGADDFIVKPFDVLELQARVAARLRKLQREKAERTLLQCRGLSLNVISHEVRLEDGGAEQLIDLTPHEYKLLQLLMSHANVVFSRDKLLDRVWGSGRHVEDRTVDKHISSLRKKLGGHGEYIRTVTGAGYKFSEEI